MKHFVLMLALAVASATLLAEPAKVAGVWNVSLELETIKGQPVLTLKQDGEKVTGTLTGPQGDVEVAGTFKESKLALAFTVVTPQGNLDIKVNGDVTGSDMKGQIDLGGMGQADFTGKKK